MTDLMEIIKKRRSVRKFEDKDIPDSELTKLLQAVKWSPSWANTQCWEIIVVKDADIKEKLKNTIGPKNPATNAIKNAPVVFAVCGKLKSSGYYKGISTTKFDDLWFLYDLGLASQSLVLTAHNLGLSTVIVGLFNHDDAKKILNVPEGYELLSLIPTGYPAQDPKAPKRRDISEFTHHDKF
jgi:nitroreductase